MENARIAAIFDEIADLLELQEANEFRVRSYRAAARTVRDLSQRLEDLAAGGADLAELPNIGERTAEKIQEILATGSCQRREELRGELPTGLPAVMRVDGIGARKAMQLHRELGIGSLEELQGAAEAGRIRGLEGFGERTEERILAGIEALFRTSGRILYSEALPQVEALSRHLEGLDAVARWEVAGSFRRGRETVGDLDVVVLAADRDRATEQILRHDSISEVASRGEERATVHLESGLQVDFRFCEAASFGAASLYFTGSKDHNIAVRRIAQDRGWKLNEYGLYRGERRLAGRTEEGIYRRLGLTWIPPALREDRGEVAAAGKDAVPRLIELDDVRGDLQSHTLASDGAHSIEEMGEAARRRGYGFLAITDHSKRVTMAQGLDDDACLRHAEAIRAASDRLRGIWLMAGIEVDILRSGRLDLQHSTLEQLDWVVASVHYDRRLDQAKMTDRLVAAVESGVIHCLGHPLGRLIGRREPLAFDTGRVFRACADNRVYVEINAQPDRLDLPDTYCREALQAGVQFSLGTDAHKVAGLDFMRFAVNVARRGWLQKEHVINTLTATELRQRVKRS